MNWSEAEKSSAVSQTFRTEVGLRVHGIYPPPPPKKKTFKLRQCKTQATAGYVLVGLSHAAFTFNRTRDKAYAGVL